MNTNREKALFALALEKPADQRLAFLDVVCDGDPALRQRMEAMLAGSAAPASSTATQTPGDPSHAGSSTGPGRPTIKLEFADEPADEAVGQTLGRYKLLEKVGEGGCGVVYVAEQSQPVRRRVALKVIKLGMDTKQVVARFEAERQALAMMDHPNIAKVLDAGTTELGRPYFVMELVRGIKITDYCDQAQLSTKARLDLFIKVCQAIQHAHQKGIIHRDIKPSNILVTMHDGVPVPKVIDFGIAKATEGRLTDNTVYTQLHQFIGTPAYMSPEQAEMSGLDIDTRSDIYSLGVLLYELLAGSTPFDARELMASGLDVMRRTIREQEPVRPSTRVATLGAEQLTTTAKRRASDAPKLIHSLKGDLDWIVMKALEKDRTRRYETANGLAADLKRHLDNEPVVARPPSTAYRFQKALRRNKLAFAAGTAVAVTLLFGIVASTWQSVRANRATQDALTARQKADAKAQEASEAREQAALQRDLARERLYESLVREARSLRQARQIGYRREAFDRLKEALALATTNLDRGLLRREASACLGDWVGLDPIEVALTADVSMGTLSADGSLAAIGVWDGTISLRETSTGREVARLDSVGTPFSLAFDRRGSSLFVVTATNSDFETGKRSRSVQFEKWSVRGDGSWSRDWARATDGFAQLSPSAEGPVVLILGPDDSYLSVWDAERDVELSRVPVQGRVPWSPMPTISSDRRRLAFFTLEGQSGFDVQVEVWDLESRQQAAVIKPRQGSAWGLSFTRDGRALAVTYNDSLVMYETEGLRRQIDVPGSFEPSFGGTFGGAANLLAIPLNQELAVRLVQPLSGSQVAYLKLPGIPICQSFSQDGSVLLVTYRGGGARLFHLNVRREKISLQGHLGGVPAVEFSPDGKHLASAGKDRSLRFWDMEAPFGSRIIGRLPAAGQTVAYSPNGDVLVCGYYNTSELSIWSVMKGQQIHTVPPTARRDGTTWNCAISSDGHWLAAIGSSLRIWDFARLTGPTSASGLESEPLITETNGSSNVQFDPKGKYVVYAGYVSPSFVQIYRRDLVVGTASHVVATNINDMSVQGLTFIPEKGGLAYVSRAESRELLVLEPETGRTLLKYPTVETGNGSGGTVTNLRASPDGSRLALASYSGLGVDLRDPATGKLLYALPEEPGTVWFMAWSSDGHKLAVSRSNGEIAVWNLQEVEAQLSSLGLKP